LFENPSENLLDILVIFFSLGNLLVTAAYGIMNGMRYERTFAYIIGGIYLIFFLCALAV